MKKILVILTGGTIGSRVENSVIDVKEGSPYRLLSLYEEKYGKEAFEVINPINLLSENMTPGQLHALLQAIEETDFKKYAGVIIAHGSDTLSYTAAFAGLLFCHTPIPIVFVASNYPLGSEGSNGLNNFARAVEFIRKEGLCGVFVLYQDKDGQNQVYLATRLREAEPFNDQFCDVSGVSLGRMEKEGFVFSEDGQAREVQPGREALVQKRERKAFLPASFEKQVLLIRPYPGMDYSFFSLTGSKKPAAVLHLLYHSATACLSEEAYNLLSFVRRCREENIPVYAASYKRIDGSHYATGDALLKSGVIPLLNISPEAAYAKLMLYYNGPNAENENFMQENIYFESVNRKITEK